MDEREWPTERFEQHRPHLRAVAYRMLGSVSIATALDRSEAAAQKLQPRPPARAQLASARP